MHHPEGGHSQQPQQPLKHTHDISDAQQSFEHPQLQQMQQHYHDRTPQNQLRAGVRETPLRADGNNIRGQLGGAGVVESIAGQQPPSLDPGPGLAIGIIGAHDTSKANVSSNAAMQSVNGDEQNGSYGTLMLDKDGRSKYLGPTAGSEWLKDVQDSQLLLHTRPS